MQAYLESIAKQYQDLATTGVVADYIPALNEVDSMLLGLAVQTDEQLYTVGDADVKFTIQSISKVLALLLALMDHGEELFRVVDMRQSSDPFNSLYRLDFQDVTKPANPMMNSGAIAITSIIMGDPIERLLLLMEEITGNVRMGYNEEVYLSEKETGDKNRAIAYLMKSRHIIQGDIDAHLDDYFKQCSIEVTATDLAKIGYFLANGCVGLKNYGKMDRKRLSKILLAIMTTAGMYDHSGEYATKVGIPTKSGVGGGIMGAVPHKMGIGIYSPPLDEVGNSVVGIQLMNAMSKELDLSIFG